MWTCGRRARSCRRQDTPPWRSWSTGRACTRWGRRTRRGSSPPCGPSWRRPTDTVEDGAGDAVAVGVGEDAVVRLLGLVCLQLPRTPARHVAVGHLVLERDRVAWVCGQSGVVGRACLGGLGEEAGCRDACDVGEVRGNVRCVVAGDVLDADRKVVSIHQGDVVEGHHAIFTAEKRELGQGRG